MTTKRVISAPSQYSELSSGASYIVKYIETRVYVLDKNFVAPFVSQTGGGKSTTVLSLMETMNPHKTPEELIKNVCFTPREFLERVTDESNEKGDIIIADEAGVSQNSKQWQSVYNRVANFILQTFRYKNLIVFFCLPNFTFLDSDTRKLLHAVFEVKKIDRSDNTTIVKPLFIQINNHTGKVYPKYLRVKQNGVIVPVKTMKIKKPSQKLIDLYLLKKNAFSSGLYSDIMSKIEQLEQKQRAERGQAGPVGPATLDKPYKPFTEVQRTILNAMFQYDDLHEAAIAANYPFNTFKSNLPTIYIRLGLKNVDELRKMIKTHKESGIFAV